MLAMRQNGTEKKGNVSVEAAQAVISRQKNEILEDCRPCVLVDKQNVSRGQSFFPFNVRYVKACVIILY